MNFRYIVQVIGPGGFEYMRYNCAESQLDDVESFARQEYPGCIVSSQIEEAAL